MSTATLILTLLAIIFAATQIWAEYRGPYLHIYIFKPLVMICIVLIAVLGQTTTPLYKILITAGLLCSMAGDTLLMPPWSRFVAGLIAFLVAHLFYIAAFASQITVMVWWPLIPLVIFGIIIYAFLAPSLDKMKIPVLAYIIVILIMAWLGWAYWLKTGNLNALLAFAGAIFFVISDSILATNRFRVQFRAGRLLNLATYFVAHWLIAGSVGAITFNIF
jgi:uncharacterized membrane protein YhhN